MQKTNSKLPVVALIGRPNVGKSSLFNALMREKRAVVFDEPGTTRDTVSGVVGRDLPFLLVDTAGLAFDDSAQLEQDMHAQTMLALEEADLIIFMVDAQESLTSLDFEVVKLLRKSGRDFVFVANKTEGKVDLDEFLRLGFGEPICISAIQRKGIDDAENKVYELLEKKGFEQIEKIEEHKDIPKMVFVGRPNVGKSSLINAFLGHDRCIVSDIPGTTRDTTEEIFEYDGQKYLLFDTAGVRRRARQESMIEHFGILRTLECLHRADVAFLLLDADEGPTTQDARVAQELVSSGVGIVLVYNKIDLLENQEEERDELIWKLQNQLKFLAWAPVMFISAKNKKNILHMLEIAREIRERRMQKIEPKLLDQLLLKVTIARPAPSRGKKTTRFIAMRQIKEARTPAFQIACTRPEMINFSYKRYLINRIREEFDFIGVPVKLEIMHTSDWEKMLAREKNKTA